MNDKTYVDKAHVRALLDEMNRLNAIHGPGSYTIVADVDCKLRIMRLARPEDPGLTKLREDFMGMWTGMALRRMKREGRKALR